MLLSAAEYTSHCHVIKIILSLSRIFSPVVQKIILNYKLTDKGRVSLLTVPLTGYWTITLLYNKGLQ